MKKIILITISFAFAFIFTACNDTSSPDYSDDGILSQNSSQVDNKAEQPHGNALDDKGKIYVCKFTRTPGGEEVLKKGNQGLVHVSANSERNNLPNFPEVNAGDQWQDRHGRSLVLDPLVGAAVINGTDADIQAACIGDDGTGGEQ